MADGGVRVLREAHPDRLGKSPGDEEGHEIDFPAHVWDAAWLGGRRFFQSASGHSAVVDLDLTCAVERAAWIQTPHPDPIGVLAADGTVITTGRVGSGVPAVVCQTDLASRNTGLLADLSVNDTGDLAEQTTHNARKTGLSA